MEQAATMRGQISLQRKHPSTDWQTARHGAVAGRTHQGGGRKRAGRAGAATGLDGREL